MRQAMNAIGGQGLSMLEANPAELEGKLDELPPTSRCTLPEHV